MIIRDKWYIIYDGTQVIDYGNGTGFRVDSGIHNAIEFDTEEEMLQHIEDNGFIIASHDEELVDAVEYLPEEM